MGDGDIIKITAVGKRPVLIGFNYMWAFDKYGLFFGPHRANPDLLDPEPTIPQSLVPNEEVAIERWVGVFRSRLDFLRTNLKVSVVRIFLFCNAINYGKLDSVGLFQFPKYLHPRFRFHLNHILQTCEDAGLQVIPVLLDFGIGDPDKPNVRRLRLVDDNRFFDMVLDPFLEDSNKFRDTIFAWEVMNEPVWLTTPFFPFRADWHAPETLVPTGPLVSEAKLSKFLEEGVRRIETAGFASTVGHRFFDDMKRFPAGNTPQFHFYPTLFNETLNKVSNLGDPSELPDAKTTGLPVPPFIGEFGARPDQGSGWNELNGRDIGGTAQRVFERLKALERKRYQLAMLWPDGADPLDKTVDPIKLSSDAELGMRQYLELHGL